MLYSLPNIVVLTIPMSLLLGVLVGIGRLASDSELIALRSTGSYYVLESGHITGRGQGGEAALEEVRAAMAV